MTPEAVGVLLLVVSTAGWVCWHQYRQAEFWRRVDERQRAWALDRLDTRNTRASHLRRVK